MKNLKNYFLIIFFTFLLSINYISADDRAVTYEIGKYNETLQQGGLVSTYFNGKVYLFGRNHFGWVPRYKGDFITCNSFDIATEDGKLKNYNSTLRSVVNSDLYEKDKANNISGTSLCTCVYNGKIYVFYDYINPDLWKCKQRYICYKTSPDPKDVGWAPDGGERIKVGNSDICMDVWFGNDSEIPLLTATVYNGKLYLFYAKMGERNIHALVFDGQKWTNDSDFNCGGNVQAISAQNVITNINDTKIGIAVEIKVNEERRIHVVTCDQKSSDQKLSYQKSITFGIDSNFSPSDMQAIFGSMKTNGSQAKNVLWIFTNRTVYSYILDCNKDGTLNGEVRIEECKTRCGAGATTAVASYVIDARKNMQMYITYVMVELASEDWPLMLYCKTYNSDYFERVAYKIVNTIGIDSGHKGSKGKDKNEMWISLPDAWTLIGVIEGVPPFTYNGNDPATYCFNYPTAVILGKETSTASTTKSTYDHTTAMGLELEHEFKVGSISGGFSFTNALSNAYETSRTIKKSIMFEQNNLLGNPDGIYGWLIFEAPTLSVSQYIRYADVTGAVDEKRKLGDVVHISVKDVSVISVSYLLENPDSNEKSAGMTPVERSTNLTFWEDRPHDDGDYLFMINPLSVIRGGKSTSKLESEESSTDVTSSTQTFNLDLSVILGSFSHECSITQESEHTTTFSSSFEITTSYTPPPMESPPLDYVKSMIIQPFLFRPNPLLKRDEYPRASWIPKKYENSNAWLLTWEITDIDPPFPPHQKSFIQSVRTSRLLSHALKLQE